MPERPPVVQRCPQGGWELARGAPAPDLRALVLRYTGYSATGAMPQRWREPATVMVPLVIGFAAPFRIRQNAGEAADHGSFLAAPDDGYALVETTGAVSCLQIDFTPLGAFRFLGQPLRALAGRVVGFGDLLGAEADTLSSRLAEARGWGQRFTMVEQFVRRRLSTTPTGSPEVSWAWRKLASADGMLRIGDLAAEIGWSRKHLAVRFAEEIGQTPKTMARILRFSRARQMIGSAADTDWPDIAAACGYADQAHLIREFRSMTGLTPTAFKRSTDGGSR